MDDHETGNEIDDESVREDDRVMLSVRDADRVDVLERVEVRVAELERVNDPVMVLDRVVDLVGAADLLGVTVPVGACDGVWLDDGVPAGVGKAVRVGLPV